MSSAPTATAADAPKPKPHYNPEEHRMTIGEHLEELRKRMFLGLLGFIIAFAVFMYYGEEVLNFLCQPLFDAQTRNKLSPQAYSSEAAEVFMTYIKAAMISAGACAGPWMLYQIWLFVAAGLYPTERKYVTKYLPLSIVLFTIGVVFLYVYVLPLMLQFFLGFHIGTPGDWGVKIGLKPTATQPVILPILAADPVNPMPGSMWINARTSFLKICIAKDNFRVVPFGSDSVTTPMIALATYFDMVIGMLLSFGVAFQLPLVVLALVRIGIVEIQTFKKMRRIVYFILTIIAAVIVPDVVTGMIALLLPLILLYEFGILLAVWGNKKQAPAAT